MIVIIIIIIIIVTVVFFLLQQIKVLLRKSHEKFGRVGENVSAIQHLSNRFFKQLCNGADTTKSTMLCVTGEYYQYCCLLYTSDAADE